SGVRICIASLIAFVNPNSCFATIINSQTTSEYLNCVRLAFRSEYLNCFYDSYGLVNLLFVFSMKKLRHYSKCPEDRFLSWLPYNCLLYVRYGAIA
ncbi:hypothetical protein L9F63_008507, partial [Diploptera punctata]